MARYSSNTYGAKRKRRRTYIILGVLIAVVVIVIIFKPSGENKDQPAVDVIDEYVAIQTNQPAVIAQTHLPKTHLPEISNESVPEPNSKSVEMIKGALVLADATPPRVIEARDILNTALHSMPLHQRQRDFVKQKLSELADQWLFSRRNFPQDPLCDTYKVKPGDQLRNIGKQYKVPYEILMRINNIDRPQNLRTGEKIKVINGPFHARVNRSTFTIDLYLQNTFVKTFPIGLGRAGNETPTGRWLVKSDGKLISPTWTDPDTGKRYEAEDPDYPLGSVWVGLQGLDGNAKGRTGFAIHGTKKPDEIGTATSRGCIRLHNGNAILVYDLMMPGYSQVLVVE